MLSTYDRTGKEEIETRNNNNEFTPITLGNTKAIKESSLFRYIESLNVAADEILKAYSVKKIEINETGRFAFLVRFKETPKNFLFEKEGFQYKECHLTIDKFYSVNVSDTINSRFSVSHYTETYQNPETKSEIIVHVYFDSQGQFINIQVKSSNEKHDIMIKAIDSETENKIKENCIAGSDLLKKLLKNKSELYNKTKAEASELELKLNSLSLKLNIIGKRDKYIKVAKDFIKVIKRINFLNELETDCRGSYVKKILSILKATSLTMVTDKNPKKQHESMEPKTNVEETKHQSKPKKKRTNEKAKEKAALVEKLSKLKKEFDLLRISNSSSPEDLIKAFQLSEEAHETLVNLTLLSGVDVAPKNQKLIDEILSLKTNLPNLEKKMDDFFRKGKVEDFKILYNFYNDKLSSKFFYELLQFLIADRREESLVSAQIIIFDFLFDCSYVYRSLFGTFDSAIFSFATGGANMSILVRTASLNNFNLFSMFLRHGCSANTMGMQWEGQIFSTLKGILTLTDDPAFVQLALQYGAVLDRNESVQLALKPTTNKLDRLRLTPMYNSLSSTLPNLNPSNPVHANLAKKMYEVKWDIQHACSMKRFQFIPTLLPYSDIIGIAMALAELICADTFRLLTIFPSMSPGVFCAQNDKQKEGLSKLLKDIDGSFKQLSYIIYSNNQNIKEHKPIKDLCCFLRLRFQECSPAKIKGLLQLLCEKVKDTKDTELAMRYSCATLFIVSQTERMSLKHIDDFIFIHYSIAHKGESISEDTSLRNYGVLLYVAYYSKYKEEDLSRQSQLIIGIARQKTNGTQYKFSTDHPQPELIENSIEASEKNAAPLQRSFSTGSIQAITADKDNELILLQFKGFKKPSKPGAAPQFPDRNIMRRHSFSAPTRN